MALICRLASPFFARLFINLATAASVAAAAVIFQLIIKSVYLFHYKSVALVTICTYTSGAVTTEVFYAS